MCITTGEIEGGESNDSSQPDCLKPCWMYACAKDAFGNSEAGQWNSQSIRIAEEMIVYLDVSLGPFSCLLTSAPRAPLAHRPEHAGALCRVAATSCHECTCVDVPLLTICRFEMKPLQMVVVQKVRRRLGQSVDLGRKALGFASEQAPASLLLYVGSSASTPANYGTLRSSPDTMAPLRGTSLS